ncbi:uncharacterized protein LOC135092599 [Scylla paramamosain]|uniref:uncharacterized protein LOC135092599 n=1 Tax=Scylla paramamosain TaxID=85552 RepID=UPI0030829E9B
MGEVWYASLWCFVSPTTCEHGRPGGLSKPAHQCTVGCCVGWSSVLQTENVGTPWTFMSVGVLVGPPCYRQSCEDALDWMIVGVVTCQVCYGDSKSVSVGH